MKDRRPKDLDRCPIVRLKPPPRSTPPSLSERPLSSPGLVTGLLRGPHVRPALAGAFD